MRGRKEARWFNRTGGSNGDVEAGTNRPVSMCDERRGEIKRGGEEKSRGWRGKGRRKKDAGDLAERKRRGLRDESEEWTTEGKLGEKGTVNESEKPGLPQDCANPGNPDTSQTRRLNHPFAAAAGRSSTPAYCGLTGWVSVTGAPLRVGMVGLAAARSPAGCMRGLLGVIFFFFVYFSVWLHGCGDLVQFCWVEIYAIREGFVCVQCCVVHKLRKKSTLYKL